MNRRFYILIIFMLLMWPKAGAQELPLTHFTSDSEVNALPSALVTHIFQDSQGYIWFSNFTSGLVRYDGSKMELYDQKDGLRDLGVWQLVEDGNGHLWSSSSAGLVVSKKPISEYKNGKKIEFTSLYNGFHLTREAVNRNQQLAVDASGRVLLGTADKGILRYDIKDNGEISTDTISTAISGLQNLSVTSIAASKGGILAGLEGGFLVEYQKGVTNVLYGINGGVENVIAILEDEKGTIWAYRQNGDILHFRSKIESPEIILAGLPTNVADITAIKDGSILASNGESGISRINKETGEIIDTYTRTNGLLNDNVYYILEDLEGNVWISQSGGVSKLRYNFNAFENFSAKSKSGEKPVLPSGKINTVLVSEKSDNSPCRFWVGTEGGATCVNEYGLSRFINQADGLAGDWVNGLSKDGEGRIWIATTRGLSAIVFDKKLLIEDAYDIREVSIFGKEAYLFSIWESPPFIASENLTIKNGSRNSEINSIWFPGLKSLYAFANGKIYELGIPQGLPSTLYKSVTIDNKGILWVGTLDRGLYRSTVPLNKNSLGNISTSDDNIFEQVWSLDNGAPTNHIEKLLWHESRLLVGTQLGLYILDPETSEILDHYNTTKGLPADNAVSFAVSPVSGNIWVGTNKGLAEIDLETENVEKIVNRQSGLIDNEVWLYGSVKVDKNGNVYYGTSKGLSIYYPKLDQPNSVPPKLQLTDFDISYKKDSRNEVNFEYAALSYANVADVLYKTRLVGYDETWSQSSGLKRLRYTNLPAYFWPKEYTLEVTAENESGVAAEEPISYKFKVEPLWWLQWWAFLIYFTLLGILGFILFRMQRERLIKRERNNARIREAELHAETANARTNAAEAQALALQAENEKKAVKLEKVRELEKAYNELKTTQKQLIQAEKMASLGRLATGVAHEIKNPLNFINNFAELSVDLVEELEEARKVGNEEEVAFLMHDLKQNTTKIHEHGKRADAIVQSMMQHARGGKPIFELFDVNDLVEKYSDLAYQGKRNQYSGFRATVIKDLDPSITEINIVGQEVGQVLLNVVGNSLDAVLNKKKALGDQYEPVVKIMTRKSSGNVEIIISDNGPGISEDIKEKVFEPFFTTKPTGEGTGLGLSLSYNIITHGHNGSLKLVNNEEEGATFIISLPMLKGKLNQKVSAR